MRAGTEVADDPVGLMAGPGLGPRGIARLITREWAHHPGRLAMALLAIALGVELIEHATIYVPERPFFGASPELGEPAGRGSGGSAYS